MAFFPSFDFIFVLVLLFFFTFFSMRGSICLWSTLNVTMGKKNFFHMVFFCRYHRPKMSWAIFSAAINYSACIIQMFCGQLNKFQLSCFQANSVLFGHFHFSSMTFSFVPQFLLSLSSVALNWLRFLVWFAITYSMFLFIGLRCSVQCTV